MLKGVNKLIIEVNNPECEYFERAIFFVKPGKGDVPAIKLAGDAEEVMRRNIGNITKQKKQPHFKVKRGSVFGYIAGMFCAAGIGAFIYSLLMNVS